MIIPTQDRRIAVIECTMVKFLLLLLTSLLSFSCVTEGRNPESPSRLSFSAEEHFRRSMDLATNWKFEEAIGAIEQAIQADSDNAEYHMMLGSYKGRTGERKAVLQGLEKALELDPGNPRYYNNRAAYYMREGMYEKAFKDIEKVFEIGHEGTVWASKDTLAWMYLKQKEYEKAVTILDDIEHSHGQSTAELRYLIILESEGEKAARRYGESVLSTLEEKPGYSTRVAIKLLLGEIDLRDVDTHHYYVLTAYEGILRHASSIVNNLSHPDLQERSTKENPVLLIRKIQPIGIGPEIASFVTSAIHSGILENGRYRIIDNDSRTTALEEIKTSLSGLTAGETDLELGRFLEAEYILAGSVSQVEGELICNIVVSHTETAQILYSNFLFAPTMKELNKKVVNATISLAF
jgi:Tfp pilus assembly protein PilF